MFVDPVQRNRFELKYLINQRFVRTVRDFARAHLVRDRFARPEMAWCYPIYSVYLDSPDLVLCRSTEEGLRNRFKLRARFYDADPVKPVFCEIKRRVNDVILKERAMLRRSSAVRLLAGHPASKSDLVDPDDLKALSSLNRFCELQRATGSVGCAIVAYSREAWTSRDDNGVRLTFDFQIRGAWYANSLDLPTRWVYPRHNDDVVLELKFTGRFPIWMRELVQSCNLTRCSVAKYVGCIGALQRESPRGVFAFGSTSDDDD